MHPVAALIVVLTGRSGKGNRPRTASVPKALNVVYVLERQSERDPVTDVKLVR